jgi:hypothetical protein
MGALFAKKSDGRGLTGSNEDRFGTKFILSPELKKKIRTIHVQEDAYRTAVRIELMNAEEELREVLEKIGPVTDISKIKPSRVNLWRIRHAAVDRIDTELLLSEHRLEAAKAALSMAAEMTRTSEANEVFAELATANNLTNAKRIRDEYLTMQKRIGAASDDMQMIIFAQKTVGKTVKLSHHEETAKLDVIEAKEMANDMARLQHKGMSRVLPNANGMKAIAQGTKRTTTNIKQLDKQLVVLDEDND